MPKLPTTDQRRQVASPQRSVRGYSTRAYEQANMEGARMMTQAGSDLRSTAKGIQNAQDRAQEQERMEGERILKARNEQAVIEAGERENMARRKTLDLLYGDGENEGLYQRKGSNALELEKDFGERFKSIREEALQGVENPVALKALQKSIEGMELQNLAGVKKYQAEERKTYRGVLASNSLSIANERAGLEYNNPETFRESLFEAESAAASIAKMEGLPQGPAIKKARSGVYLTRIASMISTDDPRTISQAAILYDTARKKGQLTLEAVDEIDGLLDSVLPKLSAHKNFDRIRNGMDIEQRDTEEVFDALLKVESGGRHTGGAGSVRSEKEITTSPAGAMGVAQLMPETAKEMARELGIDESTWMMEEVNATLGRAYLEKMKNKYDGNTKMALLAYNWGPGNVDSHIKEHGDPTKGEIDIDDFITLIDNDEARNYVGKVMRAAGGPMDKIDDDKATLMASNMGETESKEFLKLVKKQNEAVEAQKKVERASVLDDVMAYMQETGSGTESMPPSLLNRANKAGIYNEVSQYDGQTNPATLEYLYSLSAKELQDIDMNSVGIRLNLSPQHYETWVEKQKSIDTPAASVTMERRNRMVNNAFAKIGVNTGGGITEENRLRKNRLNQILDMEIVTFSDNHNGRYPNSAELQELIDGLFLEESLDFTPNDLRMPGPLFNWINFNPASWGGSVDYIFDVDYEKIPDGDKTLIEEQLQANGLPVTEANVVRIFAQKQRENQ